MIELPGSSPRAVSVTTTSAIVVRENRGRKKLVLCNDGSDIIYLVRGQTAVINTGIRLNANGGSIVDEPDILGRMYLGPWSAIVATTTSVLTIAEDGG